MITDYLRPMSIITHMFKRRMPTNIVLLDVCQYIMVCTNCGCQFLFFILKFVDVAVVHFKEQKEV